VVVEDITTTITIESDDFEVRFEAIRMDDSTPWAKLVQQMMMIMTVVPKEGATKSQHRLNSDDNY
jgi:hypothetical protein